MLSVAAAPILAFVIVVVVFVVIFTGMTSANLTERSVLLIIRAGREVELVGITAHAAISEHQGPQTLDLDCSPPAVLQLSAKRSASGIERVDLAIAEITNQEMVAERAESGRRANHSPR